jgi:hypothetical protein
VVGQWAGCQHNSAGLKAFAGLCVYGPDTGLFVELETVDLYAELDPASDVELVAHILDVAADLVGGGVGPRPRRVLDERVRVQQRRNIACRTGIRVVPPGAAHAVAALKDDEVVDARLGELDRRADSCEACADDEGVVDVGVHVHVPVRPPARG